MSNDRFTTVVCVWTRSSGRLVVQCLRVWRSPRVQPKDVPTGERENDERLVETRCMIRSLRLQGSRTTPRMRLFICYEHYIFMNHERSMVSPLRAPFPALGNMRLFVCESQHDITRRKTRSLQHLLCSPERRVKCGEEVLTAVFVAVCHHGFQSRPAGRTTLELQRSMSRCAGCVKLCLTRARLGQCTRTVSHSSVGGIVWSTDDESLVILE